MVFDFRIRNLDVENLGLFLLSLPDAFTVNECAIVEQRHNVCSDEIIHHEIGDSSVVGDVPTHCEFESDHKEKKVRALLLIYYDT